MDLEVRKYKNKAEIIINCFDTWTSSMQKLIRENYDTIEKYRRKENEIFKLKERYKRENRTYDIFDLKNEYYNTLCELKEDFFNILLTENKPLICFHASRYTDKEKDRILKFGLKTSSKDNLFDRIKNLLYDGYIDEDEMSFLKEHHLLAKENNQRENQIWVTLGNVNISYSDDSGLMNLYDNYGGEIQYFCIEKFQIGSKLNKLSKPYLAVVKLRPSQVMEYELRNLIDNLFNNVCFENSEKVESEFFTKEENVIVEDIIEIDENSKIII
jgi:hypothetical protein